MNNLMLIPLFAAAYHVTTSGKPALLDMTARRIMTPIEYNGIKEYIIKSYAAEAPDTDFRGGDGALRRIMENIVIPKYLSPVVFAEECLTSCGANQYVFRGGFCTLAFRSKYNVFELCTADVRSEKTSRINKAGLDIPENLKFVSTAAQLTDSGFDCGQKTVFNLTCSDETEDIIEFINTSAAYGSFIILKNPADCADFSTVLRITEQELWKKYFGIDRPDSGDIYILAEKKKAPDIPMPSVSEKADSVLQKSPVKKAAERKPSARGRNVPAQRGGKGQRRRSGTKSSILTTALRLFAAHGYSAVSVRDISGELNISQAALYRHYKNKRDILDSIIRETENRLAENPFSHDSLRGYLSDFFRFWTCDEFALCARRMLTLEQYGDPALAAYYKEYFTEGAASEIGRLFNADALSVYSPVYLLLGIYDNADDKSGVLRRANEYFKTV